MSLITESFALNRGNGSKEVVSMISTLESIDGLVVKKLRRGSIKIETSIYRVAALRTLWNSFETGQLNDMFQQQLVSDNALKMVGAFSIALETCIDRSEVQQCNEQLQGSTARAATSKFTGKNQHGRRSMAAEHRGNSPPRQRFAAKLGPPRFSLPGISQQSSHQARVTTVPGSRTVSVELAPSIRTVKPEPFHAQWQRGGGRPGVAGRSDHHKHGVVFVEDQSRLEQAAIGSDLDLMDVPPCSPTLCPEATAAMTSVEENANNEAGDECDEMKKALDELQMRTQEAEIAYKQFDSDVLRRLVDSLKKAPELGIERIAHVGDLRKYATILRQHDAADRARLVEQYVNVTESLERVHRECTGKIWLRLSEAASRGADGTGSNGNAGARRSPLRNRVTQSIEVWREMLEPEFNFTELDAAGRVGDEPRSVLSADELRVYGGLLSHVPAILETAKTCHQLLNHYMKAP